MLKSFTRLALPKRNYMTPILFDVSLRDGIQSANPVDYPTSKKLEILSAICHKYAPSKIEIGSFVSPKVLPIMSDTAQLFEMMPKQEYPHVYALVPNKFGLLNAIKSGFSNFSFITSVSNAFQIKNTGKNLQSKKKELVEMTQYLATLTMPTKTKLYISCVTECPATGLLNNDFIIHEILSSYNSMKTETEYKTKEYDEICISDTMGTLKCRDFEYIVDSLIRFGIAKTQLSIHLHINSGNAEEAKRILFACFSREINMFDVSVISEGGCSVTMDSDKLKPNMNYEFFNNTFEEYKKLNK